MSLDENKKTASKTISTIGDVAASSATVAAVGAVVGSLFIPVIGAGIGSIIGAAVGIIGPLILKNAEKFVEEGMLETHEAKLEDIVNSKAILIMEFMQDNPEIKLGVIQRGVAVALNKDDVLAVLESEGVDTATAAKISKLTEKISQTSG